MTYVQYLKKHYNLSRNFKFFTLKELVNTIKLSLPKQNGSISKLICKNRWFNYKCSKARQISFDLLNVFRKSNSQQDKEKYLTAKRVYAMECRNQKDKYYLELNNKINSTNNAKKWWELAKEIRGDSFKVGAALPADDFKRYFQNLLNQPLISNEIQYARMCRCDDDLDRIISVDEVKQVLQFFKSNKAPGADRVPYEMFKNASIELFNELTKTFNNILETGIIDEEFLESIIFPIHKKGDLNDPNNYRGI